MPELHFKGKEFVYNHHLTVPFRPLMPVPEKSCGDDPENLIIQGDNMHALKSLLPRYAGKVDLVFIDPPYNTGNENWCYNDNVNSPMLKEWLDGNPINSEDMLRHDKWLCMMWPRLKLLRELLSERGTLWMTIDDHEIHHARALMDEVFGSEKFVACNVWQKRYSRENREAIGDVHDYVLVYAMDPLGFKVVRNRVSPSHEQMAVYKNPNNDPRGRWRPIPMTAQGYRKNQMYPIKSPGGTVHTPPEGRCWSMLESEFKRLEKMGRIWFGKDGSSQPNVIRYQDEVDGFVPWTWWPSAEVGHTDEAKKEMHQIFGREGAFDTPKPLRLIQRVLEIATKPGYVVLDSFAGSGTTAHAVLAQNAKDDGNRKFILVECEDYADSLTAERVRRVIDGYAFDGTQRKELLREKLTFTKLKKANKLLEQVALLQEQNKNRFDEVKATVKDGELVVTGEIEDPEEAEGLGGGFTYCTLGDPLDLDAMLTGKSLPAFEAFGGYLFHTATGQPLDPAKVREADGYLGESEQFHVWLIYKPELDFLKSRDAALTLSAAEEIAATASDKHHLVFAPARFVPQKRLLELGVEHAPLPYALYRIEKD